jgi:hypothetical protein
MNCSSPCPRIFALRMVGGESRKSRRPFAATESKAPSNFRRASPGSKSVFTSKNTNLKGLSPFILRNVSNNRTSEGREVTTLTPMMITSSENTGDTIVENAFMRMV